jgi:PAS domain S-box-containing protein
MATILIVDDLSANRRFLVLLLSTRGHRLLEAANGRDALASVHTDPPDLVITDVLMPVMDGYEFVRQLRLDPTTSGIPVVFYTAHYGEPEARALALSTGVSYVLAKPAESDEVLEIVERALSGESEMGLPPDTRLPAADFGREHLRLLTDKLSEKAKDLRTSNARLRALINIGLELASERDIDRLLKSVCVSARDLFGATYATLGILDPKDRIVQRFVTAGVDATQWIQRGDEAPGILGTVVAKGRTLRGDNPGGEPGQLQLPPLHPEVQAFLTAPIVSPTQIYGWIFLAGNEGRAFTEEDEDLVIALAGQVGRIYENGYFHAAARKRADELEREILERRLAESALRTTEERMRFALEAAGVGIWDMNYATGSLQWSETLEAQYGLQPGAFHGTFEAFIEGIHPDDRESVLRTVGSAMKTGSDFSMTHRSLSPDGTVRWLNGAGRVHLGDHGNPVRGVGISLDVTERHNLEAQYQQAQKMEAVGRLAGGVAHDFNNLLTAILGYCELLLDALDPADPCRADVSRIQDAGVSAAALTRQLLAFSRKEVIEPRLLDLNVIVTEMRALLGRLIREDVKIVLGLRHELAFVKADRAQLEQVIMNLAVNAQDAMPDGGTLTIETANVELDEDYAETHLSVKPGPHVVLTVSDTGIGMSPQVHARVFEPFFTTKAVGEGTGLGLAIVHGIVNGSGGSVNVYSEPGKGTSFKVYFPIADSAEIVVRPPPSSRPHGGTETILVVEDAANLRELVSRLLQREGYTVLVAANAEEAFERAERNPSIDVLLTDVVMPGCSGPELTKQMIARRPGLRVVYMSGYTDSAIANQGILNPGILFLHKPFTSDSLGQKIREVLDQ